MALKIAFLVSITALLGLICASNITPQNGLNQIQPSNAYQLPLQQQQQRLQPPLKQRQQLKQELQPLQQQSLQQRPLQQQTLQQQPLQQRQQPVMLQQQPSNVYQQPLLQKSPQRQAPVRQQQPSNLYQLPSEQQQQPSSLYELPQSPQASNQGFSSLPLPQASAPAMVGMPYGFKWEVADDNNTYSHHQESDGQITKGQYKVLLPDGRTQVVTFSDEGNGLNSDVTYE